MNAKKSILSIIFLLILAAIFYFFYQNFTLSKIEEVANAKSEVRSKNEKTPFVYETEAENEDECSSYEYFDPEAKVCYFECESDAECKEIEKSIDEEIDGWTDEKYAGEEFKETPNKNIGDKVIAEYTVNKTEKITLNDGSDNAENAQIWKHVSNIAPDVLTDKYIETFQVFNDTESDTLAFVDDEDMNGKWRIAVNLAPYKASTLRERNMTIVHELGHIVVLNKDQLKENIVEKNCRNYFTAEGCANIDSYLNNFVKKFWTISEIEKNKSEASEFSSTLYKKDKFVTEYAATNPEEDIAESFAYFVLDKKNEGGQIKDQKTAYFYNFSDLVKVRDDMRSGVSSDIVRARKLGLK